MNRWTNYLLFSLLVSLSLLNAEESLLNTPENSLESSTKNTAIETTLSIIKPDAVKNNHIGDVISRFEKEGLRVAALKMGTLSKEEAGEFYHIHKERPFFKDLITFMSSGPIVILAIQGPDAVAKNRKIMGETDPGKAVKGSLRQAFGESLSKNAVHGSDSLENAKDEVSFFFDAEEITNRF